MSDKDAAEAYAKVWLVHAVKKLTESLDNPDDVMSGFEIAFADGYQTGAAHVREGDLEKLRKEAEGLAEYIKKLKNGSFEGWSEEAQQGYLTAIVSVEAFAAKWEALK